MQEGQPLLQSAARLFDRLDPRVRGQSAGEGERLRDRQPEELREIQPVQPEGERRRREPPPLAGRADRARLILQQTLPQRLPGRRPVGLLELREHPGPSHLDRLAAFRRGEQEDAFGITVQEQPPRRLREFAPRRPQVERHLLGQRPEHGVAADQHLARAKFPWLHDTLLEREPVVLDGETFLEAHLSAESAAVRASAVRVVVRQGLGRDRLIRRAAMLAGQVERQRLFRPTAAPVVGQHQGAMPPFLEGQLQRVRQAAPLIFARHDAVHHHVELAGLPAGEQPRGLLQRGHLAVDAEAGETSPAEVGHGFEQDRRFVLGDRGGDHEAGAGRDLCQGQQVVVQRPPADRMPVLKAGALARHDPKRADVVGDLGQRGHRGTGVRVTAGPLGDGDDRGKPADEVHVGPGHGIHHPPGLRREGLQVLPGALGMQGVEGQG